ncbi:hypothetical protein E3N88_18352 [Mikania micrantha]|uniref:Uncharacterized protein n=1 Tax=Mikania micrantha TaxID=192012 RepID=A0A5N6NUM8_9ASTR|nr:hypothetical protein E3N88_18352 [Mikania micrantha]
MDPSTFNPVLEHPPDQSHTRKSVKNQNKKVENKLAINMKSKKAKENSCNKGSSSFVELEVVQFQNEVDLGGLNGGTCMGFPNVTQSITEWNPNSEPNMEIEGEPYTDDSQSEEGSQEEECHDYRFSIPELSMIDSVPTSGLGRTSTTDELHPQNDLIKNADTNIPGKENEGDGNKEKVVRENDKNARDEDGFTVVRARKENNLGSDQNKKKGNSRTTTGGQRNVSQNGSSNGPYVSKPNISAPETQKSQPTYNSNPNFSQNKNLTQTHTNGKEKVTSVDDLQIPTRNMFDLLDEEGRESGGSDVNTSSRSVRVPRPNDGGREGRQGKDKNRRAHENLPRRRSMRNRNREDDELMPVGYDPEEEIPDFDISNRDKRAIYNRLKEFKSVRAVDQAKWVQGEWEYFHYLLKVMKIDLD